MTLRTATVWKVVLIVEDDSDGRAIAELATRSGLDVVVDWLPAGGVGNIKRIKRNAEKLIALARDRIAGRRGCVLVVVDRDRKNPLRDEPHRTIARACGRARAEFVAAREALEAWFLADRAICAWLGLQPPARSDTIHDPKQRVAEAFYRRTRRPYRRRRARLEVARQSDGMDVSRNGSAREALTAVRRCLGTR